MIENVTVRRALEFAVRTEQIGAAFYSRLAERYADDAELEDLFTKLARDEEVHEGQVRSIIGDLPEADQRQLDDAETQYLRSIARAEIFYGDNDPLSAADRVEGRQDALQLAHNLEKSTLLYYTAMKDVLGSAAARLDPLIAMEKQHLKKVIQYMVQPGSKMRGLSDPFEAT